MKKIEVEIWSDVRCPFCYIGKRKFEAALEQFPQKEDVKITWKSFQLDPTLETKPENTTLDYFIETKGVSKDQARQMFGHAKKMAAEVGLNFDLENTVVANSFKAHRLIQLAKSKGLANEMEEALFRLNFSEGKNIDDDEELLKTGKAAGLTEEDLLDVLKSDDFSYEVKQDEMEAKNIGVTGVPFFVFNRKFAVSGAQPEDVFLNTLKKAQNDQ